MAKKSRRIASRQAAIRKEGKRRKRLRGHVTLSRPADVAAVDTEVAASSSAPASTTPEAVARPRVQPASPRPIAPSYQYVIGELRRIGILAGAVIVVLIILTFIL